MLKLENIDVRYGPIHAVKDVSLTVGDSQIVAVVGSNGSGKSSLLRAVAGAEKISGGSITFDGKSIDGKTTAAERQRQRAFEEDRADTENILEATKESGCCPCGGPRCLMCF